MDLVEESQPSLFIMTDVIRLLRVDELQMFEKAQEEFAGATPFMEWMVRSFDLPLRKAKMVMERAVRYSEKEGGEKVSYRSLKRAFGEMRINIPITEEDVKEIQRPERILTQTSSIGMPSEKRMRENIASLREKVKTKRNWLTRKKRVIENSKALVLRMEKMLGS
jgi:argininosuccinate lyase